MTASPDLRAFDPLDPETLRCPAPHYAEMRATAPVLYLENYDFYLVTRRDLVLDILRDPATFSSHREKFVLQDSDEHKAIIEAVAAEGFPRVSTLLRVDPPAHTRYRRLVAKPFSPRAIAQFEQYAREITSELVDQWDGARRIDFVDRFAVPLPLRVIARALNVPDDRLADFKRWSDDIVIATGATPSLERVLEAERSVNEFQHYFAEALEQRRRHPQDDLLTGLLEARIDDDDPDVSDRRPLDLPELLNLIAQILTGGNETTTKLLAEMMLLLAQHPHEWEMMRADPSTIPAVVEESLRLASVAQGMYRITTRDVEIEGVPIPAGATVIPMFCSANRDESVFDEPDTFNPRREGLQDHLAFGRGVHYCLGASLARMEARVTMETLTTRLRSFTLSDTNSFRYSPSFILRGLAELELDLVWAAGRDTGTDQPITSSSPTITNRGTS
ncbi:MAG TPA: cytochrome P450 [Ilumatobacter sp.]|nr:cytochrome P450 [Ilumatobacter sp.]